MEVLIDVAAKIRGVIGINCDAETRIDQLREVVVQHRIKYSEFHIRQRTHR